ncbi:MAG: transcription termination/antitermination protein NusG [Candidatus Udaeobacter sp.]
MEESDHTAVPNKPELPWFGLRTKSNQEKTAARVLQGKGFEHYLPVYRNLSRWSDRVVDQQRPLFPGYLFCRFDAKKRLPIITTPGVVSIIGFGKEPAPIPEQEIEAIHTILRSGLPSEPCPFLREGQRVRVVHGCLEGVEGILLKKKSQWRMVVGVEMIQRSLAVEIDREWIAAA